MKLSLERIATAFVAVATLGLPVLHGIAFLAEKVLPGDGAPAALFLSFSVVASGLAAATALAITRRRAAAPLAGAAAAGVLVASLLLAGPAAIGAAAAMLLGGPLLGWALVRVAAKLPTALDGALGRRPVVASLWMLLGLACVAQTGRMATFISDSSFEWGPVLPEYFEQHTCLAAYLYGAELNERGAENVYDAAHYPGLDRDAAPVTSIAGMQPFLEDPFQYPPPFLLLPCGVLLVTNDYQAIRVGWFVIQSLFFAGAALFLARWVGGKRGLVAALLVPVVWASVPTMFNFQYGQFHVVALALAVLGMVAFEKGRAATGGSLLALAAVSKLFPLILLVPLVVQKRWRECGWTVAWCALFTLAGFVVLGPAPFEAFFGYHLPRLASGEAFAFDQAWPEMSAELAAANQSPLGLVQKLGELGVSLPAFAVQAGNGVYTLVILAVAILAGRRRVTRAGSASIWLALLSLAAMRSGGAWADYIVTASLWLLTFAVTGLRGRRLAIGLVTVSWVFLFFQPGVLPFPTFPPVPAMMWLSMFGFLVAVSLGVWASVTAEQSAVPIPEEGRGLRELKMNDSALLGAS